VREEMDAIGAGDAELPVLTLELAERTDYITGDLKRLRDRKGAKYVLPMTHEETSVHARNSEYKQLPQCSTLRHQGKRDEPRRRADSSLREFIMKTRTSFDADDAGLDVRFGKNHGHIKASTSAAGCAYDVDAAPG